MERTNQMKTQCTNSSVVVQASDEDIDVVIKSVTGQTWTERINTLENVTSLKEKIRNRCGISPHYQGLVFAGESLDSKGNQVIRDLGIRQNSIIRLAFLSRSGPLAYDMMNDSSHAVNQASISSKNIVADQPILATNYSNEEFLCDGKNMFSDYCECNETVNTDSLDFARRNIPSSFNKWQFSATEDTSAKESSAGETECEETTYLRSGGLLPRCYFAMNSSTKVVNKRVRQNSLKELPTSSQRSSTASARDQLLLMMNNRAISPPSDVNTHSEDGSELSSGVIVCDLKNDLRRLRVRRKHYPIGNGNLVHRNRARSKPRHPSLFLNTYNKGSDLTSSDDELIGYKRQNQLNMPYPMSSKRNSPIARAQRYIHSLSRCCICSARLNSSSVSQCRCGKILCIRHRPAEMHTCGRLRKLQDVSD